MQSLAGRVSSSSAICAPRSHRRVQTRASKDVNCRDVVGVVRTDFQSEGKVYKVTFLGSGGEKREISCPDDMYILEAAEKEGIDLPATCRGGICGACVARVAKGDVDMTDIPDLSFTLNEEEQAKGMALLCMARAKSDVDIETQCDWGYSLGVGEWQGASGRFSASPDPLMGDKWEKGQEAATVAATK